MEKTALKKQIPEPLGSGIIVSGLLVQIVLLLETVYASACINKLLLTGKEGVALGADFNLDVLLRGTGFDNLAASAGNGCSLILGMNVLFHALSPPFS